MESARGAGIHAQFTASIPENYDRFLGPVLFEPNARDLVRRLGTPAPQRVLEAACGSGILTRHLLQSLPKNATLLATDLNLAMIQYAQESVGEDPRLRWRAADMTAIDAPDGSFDAVVCQFGVMFVPDQWAAFREAHRTLAPGGRYVFNVWDALERNPFAALTHEVITAFFPNDPPGFYQVPFSFHDRALIREMLASAGFGEVTDSVVELESESPSVNDFARGLVEGNPVINEIQARGGPTAAEIERTLADRLRSKLGDRPVPVRLRAIAFRALRG